MANVKRVLVGAENFSTPLVPGQVITKGTTVTVSKEVADNLDTHFWVDKASNKQPVFVEVTDQLAAPYAKDEPAVKKKRAPRKKKQASE